MVTFGEVHGGTWGGVGEVQEQLLERQEDDHAWLIAIETRLVMAGVGAGAATPGPSRMLSEQPRTLKRRRTVEESEGEEDDEEEKEKEVERDGEGEEEMAPTGARLDKGKERAEQCSIPDIKPRPL
ncbi:hypothetical protein F5877DRAFT_80343 [Lentinula edodes]|nr:hypothetical protein F5877DRAFT_80343 [Lentinula edodes]